jgi:hypothetical protein
MIKDVLQRITGLIGHGESFSSANRPKRAATSPSRSKTPVRQHTSSRGPSALTAAVKHDAGRVREPSVAAVKATADRFPLEDTFDVR